MMAIMFFISINNAQSKLLSILLTYIKFCKQKLFERAEKSRGLFCRLEILACGHASV